ncbi:arylesterase [Sphingomicrobium sediminis]|uniref:Arylesterase n=1 Tax=Sphingomicrobium sediminis TaxID=2950949 RepID=A0A9X2EIX0_9SPHN|nr:arylesterase [Sphingomicrobium sediminis]MCM8558306.1 arylesterase [Sphingomicrobium sediminis]
MTRFLFAILILFLPLSTGSAQPSTEGDEGALVLAFGDSLTAGYGLDAGLGFAPQLEDALRREGLAASVVDAGVSGDTTSGGLDRVDWTLENLPRSPDLVILELGGNDMLRGIDPAIVRTNLSALIERFEAEGATVLLAGMRAAPNYDPEYVATFDAIYPELASEYGVALYPFFLEGVAAEPGMMQRDGIHPTFAGIKRIVTGILPSVEEALDD